MSREYTVKEIKYRVRQMARQALEFSADGNTLSVLRDKFLRTDYVQKYWGETLGILIAGFLYLDQLDKKTYFLFFDEAKGLTSPTTSSNYMLPYYWPGEDNNETAGVRVKHAEIVDKFFYHVRTLQDAWGNKKPVYYPEYTLYVPHDFKPEPVHLTNSTKDEEEIRSDTGIHYIPFGETIFYKFVWRYLIRQFENTNKKGSLKEKEIWTVFTGDKTAVGEQQFCVERKIAQRAFEQNIEKVAGKVYNIDFDKIDDFRTGRGYPEEINGLNAEKKLRCWDLIDLQIFDVREGQITWGGGIRPLLKFIEKVFKGKATDLSSIFLQGSSKDHNELIEFYFDKMEKLLVEIAKEVPWPQEGSVNDLNMLQKLECLHKTARFPIIPYYYWNVFLPAEHITHAICPIWSDYNEPLHVNIAAKKPISVDEVTGNHSWLVPNTTFINGYAVIGLKTDSKFDWTLDAGEQDFLLTERKVGFFSELKLFLQDIAQPQISHHYYGRIKQPQAAMQARIETEEQIRSGLRHDRKRPIENIRRIIGKKKVSADNIYDEFLDFEMHLLEEKTNTFFKNSWDTEEDFISKVNEEKTRTRTENEITLDTIIKRAAVENIIRSIVDDSEIWTNRRTKIFGDNIGEILKTVKKFSTNNFDALLCAVRETITITSEVDMKIPYLLNVNKSGDTKYSTLYSAYNLILSEIVTNYFRHGMGNTGEDKVKIKLELKHENCGFYNIILTCTPGSENNYMISGNTGGLLSLDAMAKTIFAKFRNRKIIKGNFEVFDVTQSVENVSESRPFFAFSCGTKSQIWEIDHCYIGENTVDGKV